MQYIRYWCLLCDVVVPPVGIPIHVLMNCVTNGSLIVCKDELCSCHNYYLLLCCCIERLRYNDLVYSGAMTKSTAVVKALPPRIDVGTLLLEDNDALESK